MCVAGIAVVVGMDFYQDATAYERVPSAHRVSDVIPKFVREVALFVGDTVGKVVFYFFFTIFGSVFVAIDGLIDGVAGEDADFNKNF